MQFPVFLGFLWEITSLSGNWVRECGMGGALHVSRMVMVILSMRMLNELHACCHCSTP